MVRKKLQGRPATKKKFSTNMKKRQSIIDKKVNEIMKRKHISKDNLGQITIRKMGKKYSVNISGTPEEIFSSAVQAYATVNELRRRYGRRTYNYFKHQKFRKY